MSKDIMFKKSASWVADGENAKIICAYAPTPGKALKKVGKLIDALYEVNDSLILQGANIFYDEDNTVIVTATVTTWK